MILAKIVFWTGLLLTLYTYVGYGLLMWLLLKLKTGRGTSFPPAATVPDTEWPAVTLLIAVYNEADILAEKIRNCRELDYPDGRLTLLFVTDGSTDESPALIAQYPDIQLLHEPERGGKIVAVDRAMKAVKTPITVLTDANTFLNSAAIKELVVQFRDPKIGAVAGEKRVRAQASDGANASGEGFYWRYESFLKKQDARWYSVVGAAGELYAVRTALFQDVPSDTILDDFMQTLLIGKAGYRVGYAPAAFAEEDASASLGEEMKRKVRICAGGFQSMARLAPLLNPLRYGRLSFQYVSHRVLRWTLAPLFLPLILISNIFLALAGNPFYLTLLVLQALFYGLAFLGYVRRERPLSIPGFFVPLYFSIMNVSVYRGFVRYLRGNQSAAWEKAKRVPAKM